MTAGKDRAVKLWNPLTGKCLKTFTGHNDNVNEAVSYVRMYGLTPYGPGLSSAVIGSWSEAKGAGPRIIG
jgi:WD40 repeat protein